MTYKELFPKVVVRDREVIKSRVNSCNGALTTDIINEIIETALEDAFLRGRIHGVDTVLSDPGAFDLFAREDGD